MLVREPWNGVNPAVYAGLSDRQLVAVYFAPRDEETGRLIPERQRGGPAEAAEPPPTAEALGVPDEVRRSGVQGDWVRCFYQVWASRGLKTEQITKRFWEATRHGSPSA